MKPSAQKMSLKEEWGTSAKNAFPCNIPKPAKSSDTGFSYLELAVSNQLKSHPAGSGVLLAE